MKTVSDHFSLLYETTPTANITELKLILSTMSACDTKNFNKICSTLKDGEKGQTNNSKHTFNLKSKHLILIFCNVNLEDSYF